MEQESSNKAKLGAFVLIGTMFLILGLYYIGSKKNIFSSTITVSSNFNNVEGLMPGNNVRFNGINVGTVSKVYPVTDTAIKVEFTIDQKSLAFINQNAIASIGTDGLLGNKLINISPGQNSENVIKEGDVLRSINPAQMDNTIRKLSMTSDNLNVVSDNLKGFSMNFSRDSLGNFLKNNAFANNLETASININTMSNQGVVIAKNLREITDGVKTGKGSLGSIIQDTTFSSTLNQTIQNFKKLSDTALFIGNGFSLIVKKINQGKGSMGMLLNDTMLVHNLNKGVLKIDTAATNLNIDVIAVRSVWPFKKYFKKLKQ